MKSASKAHMLHLDEKTIVLLARAGVQAMFDMVTNGKAPLPIPILGAPVSLTSLPAIGADYNGGKYAGLSIYDNQIVTLTLLPGDEKHDWDGAVKFAEKQGGVLPSRFDQLVLFKNLKAEFKEEWYWSGEQYAPGPSCAWRQGFYGGYQYYGRKGFDSRARAVRRSVIQ